MQDTPGPQCNTGGTSSKEGTNCHTRSTKKGTWPHGKCTLITKVTTPTKWVNYLVAFEKAPGKLRVCLDTKDFNNAIRRPHYPMRTLDDIMP